MELIFHLIIQTWTCFRKVAHFNQYVLNVCSQNSYSEKKVLELKGKDEKKEIIFLRDYSDIFKSHSTKAKRSSKYCMETYKYKVVILV